MFVVTAVLTTVLALAMIGGGAAVLARAPKAVADHPRLGVSVGLGRLIGLLEVAAGVGLLLGLWSPSVAVAVGVAAAAGIVLLMLGAISFHRRAGDYRDPARRGPAMAPLAVLVLASLSGVLRLVTA